MNLLFRVQRAKKGKERIEKSVKTFSQTGLGYFTVGNVELVGWHKNGRVSC